MVKWIKPKLTLWDRIGPVNMTLLQCKFIKNSDSDMFSVERVGRSRKIIQFAFSEKGEDNNVTLLRWQENHICFVHTIVYSLSQRNTL